MVIRHFEIKDIKSLQKYRYPEKNDLEILKLINQWNMSGCSGRYFEMFSAVHAGEVVGEISLQEHTKDSLSLGIHIFEPFRKKGYGLFCLKFAIKKSTELKYRYLICLVEKNNLIATHMLNKCGFIPMNEFINPKGVEIVTYKRLLSTK